MVVLFSQLLGTLAFRAEGGEGDLVSVRRPVTVEVAATGRPFEGAVVVQDQIGIFGRRGDPIVALAVDQRLQLPTCLYQSRGRDGRLQFVAQLRTVAGEHEDVVR